MSSICVGFGVLVDKGIAIPKYQKILNAGIVFFFVVTWVIPLWALVNYVLLERSDVKWDSKFFALSSKNMDKKRNQFNDNCFEFLTEENACRIPLPDLAHQLVVLEHIARPDFEKSDKSVLFGLEEGHQKRLAHLGERVFLQCSDEHQIAFSEERTPFWIEPILKEKDKINIVLHVECLGESGEALYSADESFCMQERREFAKGAALEEGELAAVEAYLMNMKVYESDVLVELYGGKSFESIKGFYRMCSDKGEGLFFIRAGDLFVWKNGALEKGSLETKGFPLLLIRSVDHQKCEMVLWGSEGLYGKPITIALGKAMPPLMKPQELFAKLRPRTAVSVTCQLRNRNVILREGDWVLCSKERIRNLRTFDEVKDYLRYALKGELFIFDGIVKKEGGTLFVGHLFNEDRTQMKRVEIPLSERKKVIPIKKGKPSGG